MVGAGRLRGRPGSWSLILTESSWLRVSATVRRISAKFRPMRIIVLAFAAGIFVCQLGAALPSPPAMAAALGGGLGLGALAWGVSRRRAPLWRGVGAVLTALAMAAMGWSYAAWRAELRLAEALPAAWEGGDVIVTGVVASLPQAFERGLRFVLEVEESAAPLPRTISVAWYSGFRDEESAALADVRAGERWRLTVRPDITHQDEQTVENS